MNFYNILWLTIFSLGGISLGIFGLADIHHFTIVLVNPKVVDHFIIHTKELHTKLSNKGYLPAFVAAERS